MNRRSFFSSLSSAVVGVYLGCHCNAIERPKMRMVATQDPEFALNPDWVEAPYEVAFMVSPAVLKSGTWFIPRSQEVINI